MVLLKDYRDKDLLWHRKGMFVLIQLNVFMKNMETLVSSLQLKIVYMCTAELIISKQGLANYFETVEGSLNSKMNTNYTEI